jgi:hypothetical protein
MNEQSRAKAWSDTLTQFEIVKRKPDSIGVEFHGTALKERTWPLKTQFLRLLALCAVVSLTGCATQPNGFSQFYQDRASGITNFEPYSGSSKIILTSDTTNDTKDLFRKGYILIGSSDFQGPAQSDGSLISQAREVLADVVLLSYTYLGSVQAAVPWIQYNPGQTYTTTSSGTVTASTWGSGGVAYGAGNYSGTSTTTSPGTFSTQVIPITVHRYEYHVGFFRKRLPTICGALTLPLPNQIRQQLERNTGAYVEIVVTGSPAFNANILEGDVITKINGDDVTSTTDFSATILKFAGQKVEVEVWRNGQFKSLSVQLNTKP